MEATIEIFLCYAREDEEYRQRLEKQLSIFQREGLVRLWHDGNISPGEEWEQIIHTHLNTAQIVLLLISPDFIASKYCYSVEMKKALERHEQGETRVIPVIARPIHWDKTPFGKLQALPKNAKPIALWRHRDEAFFDVAEGIRRVIEERETQLTVSPLFDQQQENSEKKQQNVDALEQVFLSRGLVAEYKTSQEPTNLTLLESVPQSLLHSRSKAPKDEKYHSDGNIYKRNHRNRRKMRLLVSIVVLLVLAFSLVPFLSSPACSFAFCHSSQQSTKQSSPQNAGEVSDSNLSAMFLRVDSPSFVFSGDPSRYSSGGAPPTDIGAVLLAKNTTSYYTIILSLRNLQQAGNDMFIDYVTLDLLQIPPIFRPLTVWTHSIATTDTSHPYPATYKGQNPGQLLYCGPSQNVSLAPEEPDQLDIQVHSAVSAYLRFKVEITYQITGAPQTLTLPRIFQVIFSDTSNWQEYILQYGSLVKKT